MSIAAMSSLEAAEHLGVSPSTIKNWAVRLPVPSWIEADGTRRFPAEALAVLETVKQMRDDERSYATIRRVIEPSVASQAAATAPLASRLAVAEATRPAPQPERVAETMAVVRPMWNAMQTEHATAARRITRLEARVEELRADRVTILAELAALRAQLGVASQAGGPSASRPLASKPWWKRLFGR